MLADRSPFDECTKMATNFHARRRILHAAFAVVVGLIGVCHMNSGVANAKRQRKGHRKKKRSTPQQPPPTSPGPGGGNGIDVCPTVGSCADDWPICRGVVDESGQSCYCRSRADGSPVCTVNWSECSTDGTCAGCPAELDVCILDLTCAPTCQNGIVCAKSCP